MNPLSLPRQPDELMKALSRTALQPSLQKNLAVLKDLFRDCSDIVIHPITPAKGPPCCLLYTDGMVQDDTLSRHIIDPLVKGEVLPDPGRVERGLTSIGETQILHTLGDAVIRVLSGEAVLLVDGAASAVSYGVQGWQSRAVEEPATETVVRGPREGFVETLRLNTALLRRKIKSPALKMEALQVGAVTQTAVVMAYLEGIADPAILQEVRTRLQRIEIDGVLEGAYLEQLIEDSPFSPFPQVQNTERPDSAAANLLEGRVVILTDGTPFALIVPVVFSQLMQASEDYYERFIIASAVRMLRWAFLGIALVLPSLYISVITFHQEMVPSSLLLSIAAAREGVPFPALVEALLMEIAFEILREAGLRLPKPVGQAVSIVGALIVGTAAVEAGIVSPSMVITVATTGIASFAIPRYNAGIAIRMLRFPLMFLAGSLGLFGVVAGLCGILIHLCSLRSFGIPYLTPAAPLNWQGWKDMYIRGPLWWLQRRPHLLTKANPVRQAPGLRPGAHQGPVRGK